MYLTFHRRVVTFDKRGTSTRFGNAPKLLKRHRHEITGATQVRNQNGQVKDVLEFDSH